jgi:predicted DNA-binding protein
MMKDKQIALRINAELQARIDKLIPQLSRPGAEASASSVMREALRRGIDSLERDASSAQSVPSQEPSLPQTPAPQTSVAAEPTTPKRDETAVDMEKVQKMADILIGLEPKPSEMAELFERVEDKFGKPRGHWSSYYRKLARDGIPEAT